jgi:cyanate permease
MGVYSFLVLGLAPLGSLQAGWVSEHLGVEWSIGLGGLVCAAIAAWAVWTLQPGGEPVLTGGSGRERAGPSGSGREQAGAAGGGSGAVADGSPVS